MSLYIRQSHTSKQDIIISYSDLRTQIWSTNRGKRLRAIQRISQQMPSRKKLKAPPSGCTHRQIQHVSTWWILRHTPAIATVFPSFCFASIFVLCNVSFPKPSLPSHHSPYLPPHLQITALQHCPLSPALLHITRMHLPIMKQKY